MSTDNFITSLRRTYTVGFPELQGNLSFSAIGQKIERDAENNPEYIERVRLHSISIQYYSLSTKKVLSEKDLDKFEEILKIAKSDNNLSNLLSAIDEIILLDNSHFNEIDENIEALKQLKAVGLEEREELPQPIPDENSNELAQQYYSLLTAQNPISKTEENHLDALLLLASNDKHLSIVIDVINDIVFGNHSTKDHLSHEHEKDMALRRLRKQGLDKIAQSKASALQVQACIQLINFILVVIINLVLVVVIYPIALIISLVFGLVFPGSVNYVQFRPLRPIRFWIDSLEVKNPTIARRIAKFIPSQCPFERDVVLFGRTVAHIPPMCKLNPLYDEVVGLRFRALCFLADECGEDISALI